MAPTFDSRDSQPVPSLRHASAPPHASTYLVPRPLKFFKRTARRHGKFAPPSAERSRTASQASTEAASNTDDSRRPSSHYPASASSVVTLTTPTEVISETGLETQKSDPKLKPQPLNIITHTSLPPQSGRLSSTGSAIHHDRLPSIPTGPPTPTSSKPPFSITCSLCTSPLSTLQIYTFPTTAPSIIQRVLTLYPDLKLEPIFCATCFESIHRMHICWGCGLRVHRREERVGCGWAWWHWGCLGCLLCRVCSQQKGRNTLEADRLNEDAPAPTTLDIPPHHPLQAASLQSMHALTP